MKLGQTILILALILVAVWYFAPDKFNEGRDWVSEKTGIGLDKTTPAQTTRHTTSTSTTSTNTAVDQLNDAENETINDTTILDAEDPCGWPNFGLPDYVGTERAGDDCADTATNADLECIANAPTNYDGWISVLQTRSEPEMRCCKLDGYCRWK